MAPGGAGGPGGPGGPAPGCPLGVVGLLDPGVPGFPTPSGPAPGPADSAPSLRLSDGVDLEEDDRLDGGRPSPARLLRSLLPFPGPAPGGAPGGPAFPFPFEPAPAESLCSPLRAIGGRGGSSSLPTSTTRSPSLFSPPSLSCTSQKNTFQSGLF